MTAPVHPIPADPLPDASTVAPSKAVGAVIPAHAPRPDASAAPSPPRAAEAHDPPPAALTRLELRALDVIRETIAGQGIAPTLAEIAAGLENRSRTNVHGIVESLVRRGLLIKTRARQRGLSFPDGPRLSTVPTAALRAELARRQEVL